MHWAAAVEPSAESAVEASPVWTSDCLQPLPASDRYNYRWLRDVIWREPTSVQRERVVLPSRAGGENRI